MLYNDLKARQGHFRGQAKAVIQLFQTGGPSQIDLFDPKPELTKRSGERHPQCLKTDFADPSGDDKAPSILFGSPFKFKRYGKCGMELSEIIPQSRGQSSEHARSARHAASPAGDRSCSTQLSLS